jgi:soluble lytic murein transglycosylase
MAASRTPARPARARARPRSRPRTGRRRLLKRGVAVAGAVGVGVLAGLALSLPEKFEDTLLEVTLPLRHDDIIRQQAADKSVDAALIAAVIYSESRFRDQTSHAGARGLMQVQPRTALDIAEHSGATRFVVSDLANPDINIRYGTFYLRELLNRYQDNQVAALAAYNAGPTNADRWGGVGMRIEDIPTSETRGYVEQVLDKRHDYRDKYAEELGYR